MTTQSASQPLNFCQACAIRNRAICADLDEAEIGQLNRIGRRRTLAPGEQLQWEGDEQVLVANVIDGVLKLSSQTVDGKEQILGLAYPSDFLGRPFGTTAPFGIEALTESQVCVFRAADFEGFATEHPRLEHKLLERTLGELDRTRRWMLLLGRMTAEQKIATFLLEAGERMIPADCSLMLDEPGLRIELPLSRQQIADVLGLTIETVSRQLGALRKAGVIELPAPRAIAVLDREALRARAG